MVQDYVCTFPHSCYFYKCCYIKRSEIEYFTFSDRNLSPLKVILTGLPALKIEDVKDGLIMAGIDTENIIEIISLQRKENLHNIHNNTNFLIKFDRAKVTMKSISNVKSIFNIIIRWYPYVSYRKGPTQCRRCQMYGHGTSHCGKSIKCLKCGEGHSTEVCTEITIKCANCGEPHAANFENCIKRSQYIAIREIW